MDRNKLGNQATLLYSLYSGRGTGHEALSGALISYLFCWTVLIFSRYCSGSLYPRTLLRLSPRIPVVVLVTLMSLVAYKGLDLRLGKGKLSLLSQYHPFIRFLHRGVTQKYLSRPEPSTLRHQSC
jgi:hypothetical protein